MSDRYDRARDMARARRLDELEAEIERLRQVVHMAAPLLLRAAEAGLRGDYDGVYEACMTVLNDGD